MRDAKRMGFSDKFIGQLWGMSQKEMFLSLIHISFTLGGTGGGFADDETQLREMMRNALSLSPCLLYTSRCV